VIGRYRFHGPLKTLHMVPRGEDPPAGGTELPARHARYLLFSGATGATLQSREELARLLRDLGLPDLDAGALDTAERAQVETRLLDWLERRFALYEVRRPSVVIPLDTPDEEVLGPVSSAPDSNPKTWIAINLVDQTGTPVPNRPYRIVLADGTILDGTLDSNGAAMVQSLDPGSCSIWCPYIAPHGPLSYVVQDGDHLSGIAQAQGYDDYTDVWNAGDNSDLQSQRPDPHVLQPGDTVAIPEVTATPGATKPTGAKYPFNIKRSPLKLRLKLFNLVVKPISGAAVTVAGNTLTTDGSGLCEVDLDKAARDVTAKLPNGDIDLKPGTLNPAEDPTDAGWRARLYNVGFLWDPGVDDTDPEMIIALEDFQAQYSLQMSKQLDDATKAKLLQVYGC
jgi:hypothetical protein